MPTPTEISSEKERLYESPSLRDDLNDNEATILLEWGESQVDRLAKEFPDEFEAKARFLRQLLKNINRFVGQREFNDEAGQAKYMKKVSMYLEPLGWTDVSERDLFNAVPDDKTNMLANLLAIIRVLSPQADTELAPPDDDAPVTSVDAHTEPIPLNNELSASSADTDMNPITAIVQDLDNMVSEIIDPAFTSDNTAEDDTPYRKQINKFLEVLSNHDEEEKE